MKTAILYFTQVYGRFQLQFKRGTHRTTRLNTKIDTVPILSVDGCNITCPRSDGVHIGP